MFGLVRGDQLFHSLSKFARQDDGATAIEYGLIAVGIAIAIVTAVRGVGTALNTAFTSVNASLQ